MNRPKAVPRTAHCKGNPMTSPHAAPTRHRVLTSTAALAATGALMALGAGAASAHVTVSPNQTAEGSYAQATFSVPNESESATTDKLTVSLPTDTPFMSVRVKPVDGWKATVKRTKLDEPVESHGSTVTEAASSITWTADRAHRIGQDEFQTFTVSLGTLPEAGTDVVLPASQHYTDGSVVKWDESAKDGAEPEHPAPTFTTTAAASAAPSGTAGAADAPAAGSEGTATAALWIGVAGILLGAVALVRTVGSRRNQ